MPEVLIVGAGVAGASVAFHLAERGCRSVTVIDANHAGEGMSSRSSALVRMHYTFEPEIRLAVDSLAYFRDWPDRVGRPAFFRECGFVRIVRPEETGRLRRNVEMQRACGADAQVIGTDELRAIEPAWNVADVQAAAYEPHVGYGDGALVASDLLSRAREMGVGYRPRTRARRLLLKGDGVRGLATDDGDIMADVTVMATGVWTPQLLAHTGVALPLENEYHKVAYLRGAPVNESVHTACIDSLTQTYFRPESSAGVLVGEFTGPRRGAEVEPLPQSPDVESLTAMVSRVTHRVPALADAGLAGGVTGLYDMTPDGRPLLGPVPGLDGLVVAAGFSGMGFKIAPAVGRAIAELIVEEESGAVNIHAFRPSRFAEGEPIAPGNAYLDD